MAKDAYYFSHDSNARNDPKILRMRRVYKSEGYGWYWALVEMLRDEEDYKLCIEDGGNALAMQMQCAEDVACMFVKFCIDPCELFASDGVHFWSNSLIRRMEKKDEKSQKARKSALSRWDKKDDDANAMPTHSERNAPSNANAMQVKERKEKESKGKEIKGEIYRTIQHLDLSMSDYTKLRENFSEQDISEILDEMENWAKLKTKRSAYLTANNWLKKREGQAKPKYAPNVEKALKLVEKYEKEEQNGGIW